MSSDESGEEVKQTSPRRSPKKLTVQPSIKKGEAEGEKVELEVIENSKPVVLDADEVQIAGKFDETAAGTESSKK